MTNAQLSVGPVGEGDPRVDRSAVVEMLTDFLLNEVPGLDDVGIRLVHAFAKQTVDNAVVFASKQHDYGPGNIASFGEFGVLVRLNDKVARLANLQGKAAKHEAVGDSWLDVANYGTIAMLVREGKWPGCQAKHLLTPPENFTGGEEADRG
jgi:hypothetical protein